MGGTTRPKTILWSTSPVLSSAVGKALNDFNSRQILKNLIACFRQEWVHIILACSIQSSKILTIRIKSHSRMLLSCFILLTGSTGNNYRQISRKGYRRCGKAFSMWVEDLRIPVFSPVVASQPESQG